ncbi:MAG: diguanylate cyclase (GGDEF)-like protein [Phenylobacterium sp.]
MHDLFREILTPNKGQTIETLFQPIFDVENQQIVGFEALSRGPQGSPLYAPTALFEVANQFGVLYELDILCRQLAIQRFAEQQLPGLLFLNVNPMILANPKYPQGETLKLVEQHGLTNDQIVIEVSESFPIFSSGLLHQALEKYRNYDFKVAIDNLGSGYTGLKQWSDLRPQMVKIDRSFIADCHKDMVKREFLRTIFELGKSTNVKVIAQGVQSEQEFEQLLELGMVYAQGFFLASPKAQPASHIDAYPALNIRKPERYQASYIGATIKQLVSSPVTCDVRSKAGIIYKMLVSNPKIQCIPVLENQRPVGLVCRHQLMERFSDTYGHALFDSHTIDYFMQTTPVILDQSTSLDQASLVLTQRNDENFSQYFIITDRQKYLGLASSRELLRRITEAKIENARYANPLTLLPGNVPIDREIDSLLASKQPFAVAYLDIDHFKPFNDVYGYGKGDLIIKLLADIVRAHCQSGHIFIGHIGGDDFIILFKNTPFKQICETIIVDFKRQTKQFFEPKDIDNRGYFACNRNGEKTLFPLVSLSIGVVSPDHQLCTSHHEVSLMASEAKKEAKKMVGDRVFYCRRSQPSRQHHLRLSGRSEPMNQAELQCA